MVDEGREPSSPSRQATNFLMFARKIRVEYEADGQRVPCPLKWLDAFSMRNFTNATVFDNTLPLADGYLDVGTAVATEQLKDALQDCFHRKSYLRNDSHLMLAKVSGPA